MVKVIMAPKGSGKTQKVIDLVNVAVNEEAGNVVCVEKGENLRFNIKNSAKLINVEECGAALSYDTLYAFICGLYSGNYDITHIFVDGLYKITGSDCDCKAGAFLEKLDAFAAKSGFKVTVTISADPATADESIKKFF